MLTTATELDELTFGAREGVFGWTPVLALQDSGMYFRRSVQRHSGQRLREVASVVPALFGRPADVVAQGHRKQLKIGARRADACRVYAKAHMETETRHDLGD